MTLIILPVRNESEHIEETALNLIKWCDDFFKSEFRILFVDDGSKDETKKKIKSLNHPKLKLIDNQFDRGKGSTLKVGFVFSNMMYRMKEDDLIIFMDSDGQISPEDIKHFINLMSLYNADVVIGNKAHTYSIAKRNLFRKMVSRIYNFMIRFLFDINYEDSQCGLKIFKKSALDKVIDKITIKKYAFDLETLIAIREMKMRIADAPVTLSKQTNVGSVSLSSMIQTFLDTISIWVKYKQGFYAHG